MAASPPTEALSTKAEVLNYYTQYIPDILYKAVHGRYPEGRGAAVHGQADDAPIAPLKRQELQDIYTQLGKDINEPLLELDKLRILKDAGTPTLCERIGKEASNIHNKSKDLSIYKSSAGLAARMGGTANLIFSLTTDHIGDTAYEHANSITGAIILGMAAPYYGILALGYARNLVKNTALSLTENLSRDIVAPQQDAIPTRAVMFNELVEQAPVISQVLDNANTLPRPSGVNVDMSWQSKNSFGITSRGSFTDGINSRRENDAMEIY